MSIKCPSLSLLIGFSLKSILLDIMIATPACFLGSFDWENTFQTLYFEVISVFEDEVYFFVYSRRLDPAFVSILLACVFL